MQKVFKGIKLLWYYIWGNIIGSFLYSKEYFPKGYYFSKWYSPGWAWILPDFWGRLLFRRNTGVRWPCSPFSNIGKNIFFNTDDLNNFQSTGCYFQTWDAPIIIGKGTYIASNVGIITSNHDINDLDKRGKIGKVQIGEKCWIGMGSIVLPGIVLGPHTIVGGGSVVTHSFPEGNVVIAGNPAKIVKKLETSDKNETL